MSRPSVFDTPEVECEACGGTGEDERDYRTDPETGYNYGTPCHKCYGRGVLGGNYRDAVAARHPELMACEIDMMATVPADNEPPLFVTPDAGTIARGLYRDQQARNAEVESELEQSRRLR